MAFTIKHKYEIFTASCAMKMAIFLYKVDALTSEEVHRQPA